VLTFKVASLDSPWLVPTCRALDVRFRDAKLRVLRPVTVRSTVASSSARARVASRSFRKGLVSAGTWRSKSSCERPVCTREKEREREIEQSPINNVFDLDQKTSGRDGREVRIVSVRKLNDDSKTAEVEVMSEAHKNRKRNER
jgi:hypothetical protein